ncbi:MAG: phosphoglucosamine mutase [Halobacteriaceae archaeon]
MDVFGSSGVRGRVGTDLGPEFVSRVAAAAGATFGADRVAVGRDTRTTGRMLADAAAAGLASVGANVDRLGVVPTPGVQAHAAAAGVPAVVVTASHNPAPYNGVKLVGPDGVECALSTLERVEDALATDVDRVGYDAVGESRRVTDAVERYVAGVVDAVDRSAVADADLRVALDPGHGAGALTSPEVFRRLGCEVVTVNAQPDGHFPGRDPEPTAANLEALRDLVAATDADLGVAHDGDGDRAIFVDETGTAVDGAASFAALVAATVDAGDVVVSAVNVSQRVVDVVRAADARLELTPIGSTRIVSRIRELRADGERVAVAGEANGGVIVPDYRIARDGAYTAARFVELLADGASASEVLAPHRDYRFVRRNVECESEAARERMLEAAAADAEDRAASGEVEVTTTDGYRLDVGDAWVLVRPSGTEPVVRVYAEAADASRAAALADEMVRRLRDAA